MDNALRLIGLARKGGRVEVGEEPVAAAARAHKARLVVLASDAADNTLRRASHFALSAGVPVLQSPYTKGELGLSVGRSSCAMLALTDYGLAAAFAQKLAETDGEQYGATTADLEEKAQRALQRQKEQRRHEKKLERAAAKPWVAPARPAAPGKAAGRKKQVRKGPGKGTKRGGGRHVT